SPATTAREAVSFLSGWEFRASFSARFSSFRLCGICRLLPRRHGRRAGRQKNFWLISLFLLLSLFQTLSALPPHLPFWLLSCSRWREKPGVGRYPWRLRQESASIYFSCVCWM